MRPLGRKTNRSYPIPVTNCLIASAAFRRHAGEDRHPHVGVIIYDHVTLGVVETMQPAGILSEGAFPSNWHGKKKGIEAGIIETLAEVTSGRDDDAFLGLGNCCEPGGDVAALLLALPTAQYDHMSSETLKSLCDGLQMGGALGYHDHTWTTEEIEQFNQRHPIGTRARLALDILRYTTGRREDAPRLGRQHVRSGRIRFQQAKNEHRNPIDIDIPLHPDLAASIAASKLGNMTFLITVYGKPFTANGFGNKFKDWCRQADLPHCSAHGVRKATSTALAEAGATPHEIMAITGHQTLEEVERYTRAASRKKTANAAMAKLNGPTAS